jgi:hypothetical protein
LICHRSEVAIGLIGEAPVGGALSRAREGN